MGTKHPIYKLRLVRVWLLIGGGSVFSVTRTFDAKCERYWFCYKTLHWLKSRHKHRPRWSFMQKWSPEILWKSVVVFPRLIFIAFISYSRESKDRINGTLEVAVHRFLSCLSLTQGSKRGFSRCQRIISRSVFLCACLTGWLYSIRRLVESPSPKYATGQLS